MGKREFKAEIFRDTPDVVAGVFRQVTDEFRRRFETIEYAVFHTDREAENYMEFVKVFR